MAVCVANNVFDVDWCTKSTCSNLPAHIKGECQNIKNAEMKKEAIRRYEARRDERRSDSILKRNLALLRQKELEYQVALRQPQVTLRQQSIPSQRTMSPIGITSLQQIIPKPKKKKWYKRIFQRDVPVAHVINSSVAFPVK